MSKIAETYIHLDLNPSLEDLSVLREYLNSQAREFSSGKFNSEVSIEIEFQSGSIKINVYVIGLLLTIDLVSRYGSFRSGIDYIIEDSKLFSKNILEELISDSDIPGDRIIRMERRLGVPGQIHRLIESFERLKQSDLNKRELNEKLQEIRNEIDTISKQIDTEQERNSITTELINEITGSFPKFTEMRSRLSNRTRDSSTTRSTPSSKEGGLLPHQELAVLRREDEIEPDFQINTKKLRRKIR
ncbi:MAG: hypothetical protein HOH38_04955 [Nitrospinaceae bacterium]|jgi:hypothetical protein|nr:hypothetical protein [Nitrospinaceae bacterium]